MKAVIVAALVAASVVGCCAVDMWWESAVIYQIYPRSFKDSDGDGIGDLNGTNLFECAPHVPGNHEGGQYVVGERGQTRSTGASFMDSDGDLEGITSKLPYLRDLGVDAIWMSPIFLSPMYDFGYDIEDYRQIAPEYGTMEDFDNLMVEAKRLGIRVVLDYVPNHTSNESEWFVKSAQREAPYEDYYIWADGVQDDQGNMQPPNNWVSIFRKSAWEYNAVRGQYYLHQFVIGQPDLNYRSPLVQQEMKDVLSFWLEKGVSGFRIDAINMMYEVDAAAHGGKYPDEPLSGDGVSGPDDYNYLDHIYTKDLDETYSVVYDWRDLLDTFTARDGESKVMMTEAYATLPEMIRYYGTAERNGSMPFNFLYLGELNRDSTAHDMKLVAERWLTYMPRGKTANWVNGNHDQSRLATRYGVQRVDAMNMLALILPGLTITYQGEELGMTDGYVSWEETKDPQACNTDDPINYLASSRDPERTPFHWDGTRHAGFSNTSGATWLPVADNYETVNVAVQAAADKSHYKFYKDVVRITKSPTSRYGDLAIDALSEDVLVVSRLLPHAPVYVAIINLSDEDEVVDLSNEKLLPHHLIVAASGVDCALDKWSIATKNQIPVSAHCAIVLQSLLPCC